MRLESLESRCLLAGDALASIELVIVDSQGSPLTQVEVGDEFVLRGVVRDLRPGGTGVFAAYTDVTFDAALASTAAPVSRAAAFSGGKPEHTLSDGELDDVGGFRPEGAAPDKLGVETGVVFFSIPLIADAAGELVIAANPADTLPMNDVLLFGLNDYVAQDKIHYGYVRLQIGNATESPPSAWRNPGNPFDINDDGVVDAVDVQQLDSELELRDGQTSLDPADAGHSPYFDVTGDRLVTPEDLAAVQRQLPAARPASGEPDADPDADQWLIEKIGGWLDLDWQIELRVTRGFEPVTSAHVGDILQVHAILHVSDEASSPEIDLLPLLSKNVLSAFTPTALAYDSTKLQLLAPLERNDAYAFERSLVDKTLDAAERLEAYKEIVAGEHWLTGASFIVLEAGASPFSTLPEGTESGEGVGVIPPGAEVNEHFAARLANSAVLQAFGAELVSKIQYAAATVDLASAATRPTAQNDTYDLTDYYAALEVDAEQGVLANDAAPAGSRALLVRPATYGTVTLNADGSFRYTHDLDRLRHLSDTFAYVVVHADGTSELAEVDVRADNVPPIAEVSVRAIDGQGRPLESVYVGQSFFLQAVVTDLRPDGVGPKARGATDVRLKVGFSGDTLQVNGPVEIHHRFGGTDYVPATSSVGPGEVNVRGRSELGPMSGDLEVFRVRVQATAAGTGELAVKSARVDMRSGLVGLPASLVRFADFTLDVQVDPSTLRLWSNPDNPLDVTGDGQVAPNDVLAIINSINARGSRQVSGDLPEGEAYLDADADNFISPRDSLAVINHLNARRRGEEPEGEASLTATPAEAQQPSAVEADLLTLLATDMATENRRKR